MLKLINIVGTALVFIAFGLWGLLDPVGMVANLGIEFTEPAGRIAIRAIYGGFLIGLGLFLLHCARDTGRQKVGLQAILIIVGTILTARTYGYLVDGGELGLQLSYFAIEVFSCIVTSALLFTGRQKGA